ncbi:MAG: DAK2 domain-containing protein, partial [Clostridia bacterium]|nr:DAK2 domain-containing protein [Clostridia bacterium]
VAAKLATSASFGARGNSGVILSQFFKGLADGLSGCEVADAAALSLALTSAYKFAYTSVARPVEGTMLTVMREAGDALAAAMPIESVDGAISVYLAEARRSLDRTPDLLPILRKAGVVDSGGSGIVCFFEGVDKYLRGEPIGTTESTEECEVFDFSLVNKDTKFDYGYCVEGLIQLRCEPDAFDRDGFKAGLEKLGNSIVSTVVGDKLKIHIHTKRLSRLMDYCQGTGEFLTIKIENMTLQNLAKKSKEEPVQKFLVREDDGECSFAVVAVATNRTTQRMFSDMGADVVIMSELAPSSQDFIDAFGHVNGKKNILVFPNSPNSILTSMQAGTMHRGAIVTVINSRSVAACYSALAMMDFEEDVPSAIAGANRVIAGITEFSLYLATKDVKFGSRRIAKNEFFSMHGERIYDTGPTLEVVTLATLKQVLTKKEYSVVTVFYNSDIAEEYIEQLTEKINGLGFDVEVATVMTGESSCSLTVTCE